MVDNLEKTPTTEKPEAPAEPEYAPEELELADRMAEATLEELPTDEEIEREIKEAGAREKVSPLDPDFILISIFAVGVDGLDILAELSVVGKPFGIVFDIFTFIIIVGWMNWRMGRIAESKKARQAAIRRAVQQAIKRLETLRKLGKVSDKVFQRYMRRYAEQLGKSGKLMARVARSPLGRSLIRGALALLGEIAWLIGLIPFWIISVILMLKEE